MEGSADRDYVATQAPGRILREEKVQEVRGFLEKGVVARWFDPETVQVILEVGLADARKIYDKLRATPSSSAIPTASSSTTRSGSCCWSGSSSPARASTTG